VERVDRLVADLAPQQLGDLHEDLGEGARRPRRNVRRSRQHALVLVRVHHQGRVDLPEIRLAFHQVGRHPRAGEGGHQDRNEHGDDADDDQQLDEREGA